MQVLHRLLSVCLIVRLCVSAEPLVCTPHVGCMRGKFMPGYDTEKFEAFLGIPYALPPLHELRFSSPKAAPRFDKTYEATEVESDCIQKNYLLPLNQRAVQGSEDCLYLNVYRPVLSNPSELLPVMVYIHGGGWFTGSSSPLIVGPEYLMDTKEVILVTLNYRLGPFGFLSTSDQNMPGNFGLKDQRLALLWVQKNIVSFGGNPKMVTLFGQSAGSVSAHLHMVGGQSNGLFRNVIALSGTANVPFAITEDPLDQARKIASNCNITNADLLSTVKLTRELRRIDAISLLDAGATLKYWDVDPLTIFRPVIENRKIRDAILTQHPQATLQRGDYKPIPWMTSFVENEGGVRAVSILENSELIASFNGDFDYLLEKLLDFPSTLDRDFIDKVMAAIIQDYFGGEHKLTEANGQGLLDVISDRGFLRPLYNAVKNYVNLKLSDKAPVFLYNFKYRGANTYAGIYAGGIPSRDYGVVHCDDLIYLFRSPIIFPDFLKNSTDAAVMRAFVRNFVYFAKYSKPQNSDQQRPCNRENFFKNSFCDYQQFTNVGNDSFEIRTQSVFRINNVKFWNAAVPDPPVK